MGWVNISWSLPILALGCLGIGFWFRAMLRKGSKEYLQYHRGSEHITTVFISSVIYTAGSIGLNWWRGHQIENLILFGVVLFLGAVLVWWIMWLIMEKHMKPKEKPGAVFPPLSWQPPGP
ncbi:MAG: hypothetical protein V1719_02810 [Patescibacteria group bacterium]